MANCSADFLRLPEQFEQFATVTACQIGDTDVLGLATDNFNRLFTMKCQPEHGERLQKPFLDLICTLLAQLLPVAGPACCLMKGLLGGK